MHDRALVWFRRDLRVDDHAALSQALSCARRVHCVFVFDTEILDQLVDRADRRVEFIWECVVELRAALAAMGGGLIVEHARARDAIPALARRLQVQAVYAGRDYEPAAASRDLDVERALAADGIAFETLKDQVVFERAEIMTGAGTPFSVFTPYRNAWLARIDAQSIRPWPVRDRASALAPSQAQEVPALEALGFVRTNLHQLRMPTGMSGARALFEDFVQRIEAYGDRRDFPATKGPSYLSVHLRFGTISIRELVRAARANKSAGAAIWLSELIWREFYFMILHHHPQVVDHAFRPEYDAIEFPGSQAHFEAWCAGSTGYPLVDAGMRQLNQTGYMHNRLRMVTASFLVKDLHVDWRAGERYFARKLNDYDLAANNGGWQWAASTGCDAQPYFRIFNPVRQSERFDPDGRFIRMYVPELVRVPERYVHAPWMMSPIEQQATGFRVGIDYPAPLVDHAQARVRALELYGRAPRSAAERPIASE